MLENSFGLFFFLKKPKNQSESAERYVYLRITVDGIPKELSLKRTWTQERWNHSSGRAAGTKEDARSLNAYMDTISAKVYQAKAKLVEIGRPITAENLKNYVTGKSNERKTLLDVFREHNNQMKALLDKEFVYATLQRYNTTFDHTKAFIKWKYNIEDIDIQDLNYEFASDFAFWLRTEKNCNHNSTMKYISNVKKIVLKCIRRGWINRDPFMDFKTTRKEVERVALTQDELNRISVKSFGIDRLSLVRDISLFSCYTGFAYIDVSKLKRTQIVKGIDGNQWIMTHRQKTDSPTRLPLLPVALEIIEQYRDHPKCKDKDYVLPVLTNQKMNAYLKEIADMCGITKKLTFHIARHTFATTVTLSNGVPIETVSKMLGHKSLKQAQHYAKILDTKISQDMQMLKGKLEVSQ